MMRAYVDNEAGSGGGGTIVQSITLNTAVGTKINQNISAGTAYPADTRPGISSRGNDNGLRTATRTSSKSKGSVSTTATRAIAIQQKQQSKQGNNKNSSAYQEARRQAQKSAMGKQTSAPSLSQWQSKGIVGPLSTPSKISTTLNKSFGGSGSITSRRAAAAR